MLDLFFPRITRREKYQTTHEGHYYADYFRYREEIREDCLNRCVYCDGIEEEIGGEEIMELDHFRPKSHPDFPHLKNDPFNLVWSCSKCNHLKSNHWPSQNPDLTYDGNCGFIDPFLEDRRDYFNVDKEGGLISKKAPAEYKIRLLLLNRPHRRLVRQKRIIKYILSNKVDRTIQKLEQTDGDKKKEIQDLINLLHSVSTFIKGS